MEVAIPETSVIIELEEYSILSGPEATSKLVQDERDHLLGSLNLNSLVNDLGRVGKLVRLAYYAAKGTGYKEGMVGMKMMIYDLGINITKLCNKSAQTVSSFRAASRSVLQELHAAYEALLEGYEEEAVDGFSTLAKTAKKMAEEAHELKQHFERQREEVRNTIKKLEELEDKEGKDKVAITKRRAQLKQKEEVHRAQVEELQRLEDQTKQKKEQYETKRDEEIKNLKEDNFLVNFGRAITGAKNPTKEKIKEWKEESIRLYEIEKKHRKLRNEVLERETDIMAEMETCNFEEGETATAIKSLQAVSNALMQLAAVMMRASLFWESMKKQCENIASNGILEKIESAIKLKTKEDRLHYWHSRIFKVRAVNYCAMWVALHGICSDYVKHISLTQGKLSGYITENPSLDEARVQIKGMIAEIKEDAKKVRSTNEMLNSVADDKIKKLNEFSESEAVDDDIEL